MSDSGRLVPRGDHSFVHRFLTPHGTAIHPDSLAEAGVRRHYNLLLKQLLVVHWAVNDPERFRVTPILQVEQKNEEIRWLP